MSDPRPAPAPPAATPDQPVLPRVLFVDDEENILKALRRLFRSAPWEMRFAGSGREALELFRTRSFDVVVADQRMPDMTGVELLKRVRANWPRTIRIVLSGYSDIETILEAVNEGSIFKFLTKPWDDSVLRRCLEDALESVELRLANDRLQAQVEEQNAELGEISQSVLEALRAGRDARSLALAKYVLDAVPIPVLAVGDDGAVAMANRAVCRLFGVPREEALLGRSVPAGPLAERLAASAGEPLAAIGWTGRVYVLQGTE
ncbi:MAG: response regulator [Deltaproteobacteria bacterium]|nr:response regulator [Deltaproteobacteria bacterium]